jgi:hypothetical protein
MLARRLLAASATAILTAGVITASAVPAHGFESWPVTRSGWAYVDSHQPETSFINPPTDAPIGAWTGSDGSRHRARSYFSFDVSRFRGTVIHEARLVIKESWAADCVSSQPVELWRTDPITATTSWSSAPHPIELIGTVLAGGPAPCPGYLVWDVMPILQKMANQDGTLLTVMIRVPNGVENDLDHGRRFHPYPGIDVKDNHTPAVAQIGLEFRQWACGTRKNPDPVRALGESLAIRISDPDPNDFDLRGQFAAWPVDDEDQRTEVLGGSNAARFSNVSWDMSRYPHGTVVAWTARAFDGYDYSEWAKPCYVQVDAHPPVAPTVTSSMYPDDGQPHGGEGVPGTFVFGANGSTDVVGYFWGQYGSAHNYVPAPSPGADVTIDFTPTSFIERLTVESMDAAGWRSPATEYTFVVRSTAPQVDVTMGGVGLPSRLHISTSVAGVTEFGYVVGDAAEVRVPASAEGTADVEVVFAQTGYTPVQVGSYAGGELVGAKTENVLVTDSPVVESADFAFPDQDGVVGRQGSFTFRPRRTGVVAYEYFFLYDGGPQRIDAGPDGTAVLQWTPTKPGFTTLDVRSISADGTLSEFAYYDFYVIDAKPMVYSSTYYQFGAWGGVGIPGDFDISTQMPNMDVFVYRFNDGPEQIVDPDYNFATVTLTPDHSGSNTLTVRTRFLDGSFSPETVYTFQVSDAPVVVSTDYPAGVPAGQPGQPGTFTFNPGRDGITQYRYQLEFGEEQVVAAGPDGKATVEITPTYPGYTVLVVTGFTADGTATAQRRYNFYVRDPRVGVYSAYDEFAPRGGIGSTGIFSFYTQLSEVTSFEYQLNGGTWQSVPTATDSYGTSVTLTMERNGENLLSVRGRTDAGQYTPQTDYPFLVGTAPLVTSTAYPESTWAGGVGVPGDFTFTQGSPGVVEFEYRVDDGAAVLVTANEGVATVTYTPTSWGSHTMTVRGRTAEGVLTDPASYYFLVNVS